MIAALAVSAGAALGALLRWAASNALNGVIRDIPLGTLAVNVAGGFLIGLLTRYFATAPGLAPELRLAVVTGFCGALTTFSTFSLEAVTLIKGGKLSAFAALTALHLAGSLAATLAGLAAGRRLFG